VHPEAGAGLEDLARVVSHYGPSPATHPTIEVGGEAAAPDPAADLAGVVFNVKSDPHVGKVCLARILTGWTVTGAGGPEGRTAGPLVWRFAPGLHGPGGRAGPSGRARGPEPEPAAHDTPAVPADRQAGTPIVPVRNSPEATPGPAPDRGRAAQGGEDGGDPQTHGGRMVAGRIGRAGRSGRPAAP